MQGISERMGENQFAKLHATCMDCGKDFTINLERTGPEQIEINDGVIYSTKDKYSFKCKKCFQDNPNHGPKVEIYSRVVGYLRPIRSWNNAKQEEFKSRKNYSEPAWEKITARESKYIKTAIR